MDCRIPQVSGASCFRLTSQLRTHFGISIHFSHLHHEYGSGMGETGSNEDRTMSIQVSPGAAMKEPAGRHRTSRGGGALIEIGIDEGACSAASTRGAERSRLAGTAGTRRCVERCCASTRQTRRSDSFNPDRTWSMQARRRAGLRSFPLQPPRESFCPRLDRRRRGVAGRSPPRAPSSASPDPSSVHRTPDATYSK